MFKGFSKKQSFNVVPSSSFGGENFSAYSQPNCKFWLDASYGTSTIIDGQNISSWQTKIGELTFLQQTAGSQPSFVLADPNFNNLPTVLFLDNRFMTLATGRVVDSYGPNTSIVIVVKPNLVRNNGGNGILFRSGIVDLMTVAQPSGMGTGPAVQGGLPSNIRFGGGNSLSPQIIVFTRDRVFVNGIKNTIGGPWEPRLGWTSLSLADVNYSLNANLAEMLIFSKNFTDEEVAAISTDINAKYAIY